MSAPAPLTPRQREVLDFVQQYIDRHSYPPTSRELSVACGLGGPSGAQRILETLERKGYLRRTQGRSRALVVVQPDLDCASLSDEDRFLVSATAEAQAVARDCVLAVAALTQDSDIKAMLIRDALERHDEVVQIEQALARSSCGPPSSDGAMRAVLAALRSDLTWPTFVVDHLVYNVGAAQGSRLLADQDLGLQALFERGAATCERAIEASVGWLAKVVASSSDEDLEALRRRAEFMMKVCAFAARAVERPGGARKFTDIDYSDLPPVLLPAPTNSPW
jgi:hypothetical protein